MGTTSQGIVYPDDASPIADIQDHLEAMAESIDAAIAPALHTAAGLGIVTAAGWTLGTFVGAKLGLLRVIQAQMTRTGGTITGPATGDLSPNVSLFTDLPVDWRPVTFAPFTFIGGNSFGAGSIESAGNAGLATFHATGTILAGQDLFFNAVYLVAT